MNIRNFALSAAAFYPSISDAFPETGALHACARALAASIAVTTTTAPICKLDYRGSRFSGSIADYFPTNNTFELEVHGPNTGLVITRARCSTNTRGNIVA